MRIKANSHGSNGRMVMVQQLQLSGLGKSSPNRQVGILYHIAFWRFSGKTMFYDYTVFAHCIIKKPLLLFFLKTVNGNDILYQVVRIIELPNINCWGCYTIRPVSNGVELLKLPETSDWYLFSCSLLRSRLWRYLSHKFTNQIDVV
jgi:hypothetical protein